MINILRESPCVVPSSETQAQHRLSRTLERTHCTLPKQAVPCILLRAYLDISAQSECPQNTQGAWLGPFQIVVCNSFAYSSKRPLWEAAS